ncbi:DVU_1556 family methyltransferase [Marinisporobacter balticus]|uniref:Methyltransferase family protein n=1 Tax=Marinisporobacter balticus TaxID=2018667 RepID=A0A4R2KHB8_9FIRM|nr:class I SAM-dependent methyltransferase [Marinisporobacter balticus]TCO71822.1 methyltransferase family protein [Marinisporobacter balticus]
MDGCNAYESRCMSDVMGETLRPGGFDLTEKAIAFCNITDQNEVLDLGCGMGATVRYLYKKHNIKAVGIDPSEKLLKIAKEKCVFADFVTGTGDFLPFPDESFHCVFAECTLSLMNDLNASINEVHRVLKKNGCFIITDVYAKNPSEIQALESGSLNSCMRGLHDLDLLQEKLKNIGFEIVHLEDCSDLLKALMVKIIFSYGSMDVFWNKATNNADCMNGLEFQKKLKLCKPGYFILIGRKGEA